MSGIDASRYTGCLVGGAAGDALGYPVEFMSDLEIVYVYGKYGITQYSSETETALFSDDTQMTLFTAAGLLTADAESGGVFESGLYLKSIADSYTDWLETQQSKECAAACHTWLANIKGLYSSRAPGMTCLSSVRGFRKGKFGSIENPLNDSMGCGGLMRVAPIGLWGNSRRLSGEDIALFAAKAAALTHGHELGYIPAAAFAHIISSLASGKGISLTEAVQSAVSCTERLFPVTQASKYFVSLMNKAVELAGLDGNDILCIDSLGKGWVAQEALAIAVYCALKYENDFERAIITSVNHSGDSDSTGSVTGNILGAYLGIDAIPEKFKTKLELYSLITTVAQDLAEPEIVTVDAYKEKYTEKNFIM